MNFIENGILIWHDNGVKGQHGCTEYSKEDVEKEGGLEALIRSYEKSGITIHEINALIRN